MKVSDERLKELEVEDDLYNYPPTQQELNGMAKELLALRKVAPCPHQWNALKLVECGGRYQYCTLCGAKKVAE